jgi:hypothetical protein
LRTEFYKLIKSTFIFAFAIIIISIILGIFLKDIIIDFYLDVPYDVIKDVVIITSINYGYVIFFGAVLPILLSFVMFVYRHELSIGSIKRIRTAFLNIFFGSLILLSYAVFINLYSLLCLINNPTTPLAVIENNKFGGYYLIGFIIRTFAYLFIGIGIIWSILQLWHTVKKKVKY